MRLTELALRRAGAADLEEFQRREGLYPSGQEDILTMQRLTPLLLLGILVGCMMIGFGAVKLMGYFSRDLYRLAFQFDLAYGILLIVLGLIVLVRRADGGRV